MQVELPPRTPKQNNSLHLYLENLAQELNDKGITLQVLLSKAPTIQCTKENLKDNLWRPLQRALYGVQSTRNITTVQCQQIWEEVNKFLGEQWGVHVNWPCIEEGGIEPRPEG